MFSETRSCEDKFFSNTMFGIAQAVVRPLRDCPCGATDSSSHMLLDVPVIDTFKVSNPWRLSFLRKLILDPFESQDGTFTYFTCGSNSDIAGLHLEGSLFDEDCDVSAPPKSPLSLDEHYEQNTGELIP